MSWSNKTNPIKLRKLYLLPRRTEHPETFDESKKSTKMPVFSLQDHSCWQKQPNKKLRNWKELKKQKSNINFPNQNLFMHATSRDWTANTLLNQT